MALQVEDLEDQTKYRQILSVSYDELVPFVIEYIKRRSVLIISFWAICIFFLGIALIVRINISVYFPWREIFFHTVLGLVVFPVLAIPVHEFLHIIPYFLSGAKRIRVGMDLRQYMFYVTAHRYVSTKRQFIFVALVPFILVSTILMYLVFTMPGLWKWSLSLFIFMHATMCAGDFAMLNFYFLNKNKKIYTWDDFDKKIAYFYEEL